MWVDRSDIVEGILHHKTFYMLLSARHLPLWSYISVRKLIHSFIAFISVMRDVHTFSPLYMYSLTGKSGISPKKSKYLTPLQQKLNELYEAVKNYTDKRGRRLSTIFLRLPSRAELPDYYVAIKKPVDMEKIKSHMLSNKYQDVDALVEDLVLMFNNACTYNEPESLIYKDALVLHKVGLLVADYLFKTFIYY